MPAGLAGFARTGRPERKNAPLMPSSADRNQVVSLQSFVDILHEDVAVITVMPPTWAPDTTAR